MGILLEALVNLDQHEGNFTKFGDFDGDGDVDDDDFNNFLRPNMLASVGPYAAGDVTGDGVVDSLDFDRFKHEYYEGTSALSLAIPEPSALALAVLGCSVLVARRRRSPTTRRSRQRLSRTDDQ